MSYFTTTKTIYDSVHEYPNKKKRGYGIIEGNPKVYDWTRTTLVEIIWNGIEITSTELTIQDCEELRMSSIPSWMVMKIYVI